MIILAPIIIVSSTIPIVDYNPPRKYILDNDYSECYINTTTKDLDPLTDFMYKVLSEEIERGQHGPIRHGE